LTSVKATGQCFEQTGKLILQIRERYAERRLYWRVLAIGGETEKPRR